MTALKLATAEGSVDHISGSLKLLRAGSEHQYTKIAIYVGLWWPATPHGDANDPATRHGCSMEPWHRTAAVKTAISTTSEWQHCK